MAIGGERYERAKRRRPWSGGRGIAELLAEYEGYCRRERLGTDGWARFRHWALNHYRPYYYHVAYDVPERVELRPWEARTLTVRVTNRSRRTIPAADPGRRFALCAFRGERTTDWPDESKRFGDRVPLPPADIAPGGTAAVAYPLKAPRKPGPYRLHFDLIEIDAKPTWFGREGSPVGHWVLVVLDAPPAAPE